MDLANKTSYCQRHIAVRKTDQLGHSLIFSRAYRFFRSIQMRIVFDYVRQYDGIASSVGKMELSSNGVCNTVTDPKTDFIKCHSGQTGCIVYLFTRLQIISVRIGKRQELYKKGNCFLCQRICKVVGFRRYICLKCVCQRIHTGVRRDSRRNALYKFRIQDSYHRLQRIIHQRIFDSFLRIGDHRKSCYL